ncbi:MAG: glycosyltransferase [Firmicutes bacterium]|nr:glycosyltransferase [Bacillota bacterium]
MYIAFLNPQGNFDKFDSYWTMHPDFGGQLVYVKEIASSLAKLGHQVDIITRQFDDGVFPEFKNSFDFYDSEKQVRIVRIPCGPTTFLNKEYLWDYLSEWTENIIKFFENQDKLPDFLTGHYGDGGLACAMIKQRLHIPYSFTGHSLGAQKLDKIGFTLENFSVLDEKYKLSKRILAERIAINNADIIFVSTKQERDEQYFHPLYQDVSEKKLRSESFVISPPGANTSTFSETKTESDASIFDKIQKVIERDISASRIRFSFIILASRLDAKKNHISLLKAYAMDTNLQLKSNLIISLRGIQNAFIDYSNAKKDELSILDDMMKIITDYHLIGKVCFISVDSQQELAALYKYLSYQKSVFALTSLYEPFGLAPIEAMCSGLPVVVTKNGGPSDVLLENNESFGVLVDPLNLLDIQKGLHEVFTHYLFYKSQGKKRVASKYTWDASALTYYQAIVKSLTLNNKETCKPIPDCFATPNLQTNELNYLKNKLFNQKDGECL